MRLSRRLLFDDETRKAELLSSRVCDLPLRLPGSLVGRCVERALEDARAFGIALEPHFYLSDGYGCVQGTANIGLGFWDADELLRDLHADRLGRRRDEMDLLLLLRHEIGHAFCYAHKLYLLPEFRRVFGIRGNFFATYPEHDRYRFDPYSVDHVNPDFDWYAQKHPDDDFAETFAVFLDRTGGWKERYRGRLGALRKIAYVGGAPGMYIAPERLQGYLAAMDEARLPTRVVHGDFRRDSGYHAAIELLASKPRPEALFVANLLMTTGVLEAANDLSLSTPEHFGLAAFDSVSLFRGFRPNLTAVVQPSYEIGYQGANLLLDRIEGVRRGPPVSIQLPCQLKIGESSRRPK